MDKIRSIRTPTPPKLNFDASMEILDKRHAVDSLADINADEFKPKAFNSSANVKPGKSEADIIKIKGETRPIKVDSNDDPLFHQKVRDYIQLDREYIQSIGDIFIKYFVFNRFLVMTMPEWNNGSIECTLTDRKCLPQPIDL